MTGTRPEWAVTVLVSVVSFVVLVGTVVAISGGILEYQASVARLCLLCATVVLVSLLFRPDAIRLDRRAVPSLIFATVAILSVLASPGFTSSLARLELYYSILVVGLAMGLALPHCLPAIGKIILLTISLVHAGFLLIAMQSAMAAVGDPEPVVAVPFFLNLRHFGYQGYFGASAAVAVALTDRRLRTSGVLLATAALFGIVMFGSRGALLAWILFVLVAFGLTPNRRDLVLVSLLTVAGAFALAYVAEKYDWLNTLSLLDRTRENSDGARPVLSFQSRIDLWKDSLTAILQRPVLGFGPEGYQISRCCSPYVAQPHNSILQFLLEFGVLGLAVLIWAASALFGPRIREVIVETPRSKRHPVQTMVLAIAAGLAGFSMIDGLLYHPIPLTIFVLVCAVLLAAPLDSTVSSTQSLHRAPIQSPTSSPDT